MKRALHRLFGAPAPRELVGRQADAAAQAVFAAVAGYARIAREDTIAGAAASIAALLIRQLARTDAGAARDLCSALASRCAGADADRLIAAARARLRQAEREALK
ncbi:MAG: hypothetical protein BroJett013_30310 [Alphaproteobacteria bacterium]|nr:MAG: hypothetical protein BroJett013_30310 [Alphaproteobacteria bacterium]